LSLAKLIGGASPDQIFDLSRLLGDPAAAATLSAQSDLDLIRCSGLFDDTWYRQAYPGAAQPAIDAVRRYHEQGWRLGHRPNWYFDPVFYRERNPDVGRTETDPLLHYIRWGEREGRRPVPYFDPAWYRSANDLAPDASCLRHFLERRHGGKVSPIPEFDAVWYLETYPDVAAAGMDPCEHYLVQGFKESRNPSPDFDTRFYRQRYLNGALDENPLLHFLAHRDRPEVHARMPAGETTIAREVRRYTQPGPDFEPVRPLPASAARRACALAFYLPQFHTCPENDAWWGRGFTEWTNLPRALPRFAGHYQPRIPRDLGHYALDNPAVMRRQIELAKGGGLHGFVFYFYWFNGRRLLDRPLDAFLADPTLDFPFCLMWANENWSRRWDGSERDVLISQDYRAEDEPALVASFARHFADSRYIRLGGRPLLMVYRPGLIPDAAASVARWRARFRGAHGEDPLLVMAQTFENERPTALGLDGAVEFPPHKLSKGLALLNERLAYLDPEFTGQVYDYDALVGQSLGAAAPDFPLIKTAIPGWDNDARRQGAGLVVHGATPAKYEAWLGRLVREAEARPFLGTPLVCINAWNEWAEGAYLEPDLHFGAAFLNATARAIAGLPAPNVLGRLLLVGHDAFPAGAQSLLLHLGRVLARRHGVAVEFLLLGGGALESAYAEAAPLTVARNEAEVARALERLAHEPVRAAIVNTAAAARLCPRLARQGIACTLLLHELPSLIAEKKLLGDAREGTAAARAVVFASPFVRDRYAELVPFLPERAVIRPQGSYKEVCFSAVAREMLRASIGVSDEAVLAIGIGYGDLRKGFDLFLQVWRILVRRRARVHLAWIGDLDPALATYLGAEIAAAEASGTFRYLGFREDATDWLSAADVLLLTSREDAFPTVVLEALSAGTPAIAFEGAGGIPDLLRTHQAGEVVKLGDVDAVARRLAARARSGERPDRARLAAIAREQFAFADYAEDLLRLAQPGLLDISAVVPNHNYARYLPARLASIFAQVHPLGQAVLLDDASSDDSVAVAQATAVEWRRELAIVRNPANSGSVFRQWRRAAELARGEFLWIAEADDTADPRFLEKLAEALALAPDALLAFSDSRSVDAEDLPVWPSYQEYYARSAGPGALARDETFSALDFARRFLAERNLILNASAVLWRREKLLDALRRCEAELDSYHVAGDWRVYLELLTEPDVGSVAYVASPLNVHRRHGAGVTSRLAPTAHIEEIRRVQNLAAERLGGGAELRCRQQAYLAEVAAQLGAALPP
jgi:hypothetical protein